MKLLLLLLYSSDAVDRASDSWLREPAFESCAAGSTCAQRCAPYIAPIYAALKISS